MRPFPKTRGRRGRPSPISSRVTWAAARFSACCSRRSALNSSPRIGPSASANKRTDGIVVVILIITSYSTNLETPPKVEAYHMLNNHSISPTSESEHRHSQRQASQAVVKLQYEL